MLILFEYAPLILFFLVYKFVDIFWATGVLIAAACIQIVYYKFAKGRIETKHWILFGLAVGLGSLTIIFHDERFIKWKATLVYLGFAVTLIVSRYGFKQNLIEKMFSSVLNNAIEGDHKIDVPKNVWERVNWFWISILLIIAAVNLLVANYFSTDVWVNVKVFGFTAVTFVAFIITIVMLYKYLPQDDEESEQQK